MTPTETTTFEYKSIGWIDQLVKVNDDVLTYDENGNVLTYGDKVYTWERGRVLKSITEGENTYSFAYDEDGLRTRKTANGVTTYYNYVDGQLVSQKSSNKNYPMIFEYNTEGQPVGFVYRNIHYYYLTNQMGDVIGVTDTSGNPIALYHYDEWGNLLSIETATEGNATQLEVANANPLRYRGYYYDTETGYYYLQSRYYDPSICRFINADMPEFLEIGESVAKWNLFSYCENDAVNNVDYSGYAKISIAKYKNKNWLTKMIVRSIPNIYVNGQQEKVLYNKSFLGVRLEIKIGYVWQTNASGLFGFLLDTRSFEVSTSIDIGKNMSYSLATGVSWKNIYVSFGVAYAPRNVGFALGLTVKLSVSHITAVVIAAGCVAAPYFGTFMRTVISAVKAAGAVAGTAIVSLLPRVLPYFIK